MIQVTTDAHIEAARFAREAALTDSVFRAVVDTSGRELLYTIKLGASGWRGGPKIVTGRYYNSIRSDVQHLPGETTYSVGTDEPYGYMLELGGVTRLPDGRSATIKPHPHFGNGLDWIDPDFMSDIFEVIHTVYGAT